MARSGSNDGGGEPRLWWIAGDGPADLLARLDQLATTIDEPTTTLVGSGAARLAVGDPDERRLRLARRMVEEGEPWRGRGDVWFSPGRASGEGPGKVVFVFPGVEPGFGAEDIDLPALAERVGLEAPEISDDTLAHRSASIYRLGIFLDLALRRLGVTPDIVAGHSIGEWSGSVASGMIPHAHSDGLLSAVDLDEVELPDLDFAALSGGAEAVAEIVGDIKGVVVSHDNSPGQSVICGPPSHVDEALARLRDAGILGYRLTIQSGFHTPFMEGSLGEFRAHLAALPIGPPTVPMWSATDVGPYPTTRAEIVDLHLRHLIEPVRFRPLVERLYHEAGVRIFVQVGIGSVTSFIDDTLRDLDHASIQLVTAKRSALAQVQRALAALWVEGIDVRPDALAPGSLSGPSDPSTSPTSATSPLPPSVHNGGGTVRPPADRAAAQLVPLGAAVAGTTAVQPDPVAPAASAVLPYSLVAAADLLSHAAAASQQVIDALASRLPGYSHSLSPSPVPMALVGTPAAAPPPLARPLAPAPEQEPVLVPAEAVASAPAAAGPAWPAGKTVVPLHLSLENRPETLDHCLFEQPAGWHDPTDGFPIMAMTTQIQMLQDIASAQAGGRPVVEVFDVRNFRWLDLSDPQDVDVTVVPKGDDVLTLSLGNYCRVNVRIGSFDDAAVPRYDYDEAPLANPRPSSHTAEQMFDQRVMFHGPMFQGIDELGPTAGDGMLSVFDHLETPGSLLDNLGKVIAYWVIEQRSLGESPLPIGVERIRFFGPDPVPGTKVRCDVRIVELQDHLVKANGELILPDGTVWCRVDDWSSHIFHLDEVMEPIYHRTGSAFATEPQDGDWNVVIERWPTGAGRDLTARRFLNRPERAIYAGLNLLEQRRWLIEVAAVKESVRQWLHEEFGVASYPVEIDLVPDGDRRYRAVGAVIPSGHDPRITVSSVPWLTVAVLGDGRWRDIEARLVEDEGAAASVAAAAAEAVSARNPGASVGSIDRVDDIRPSRIEVVVIPHFAVAWTS
jgi:malonyl CoA-acyl carrier protein transacylase